MADSTMEQRITEVEADLRDIRQKMELLSSLISRYQFADPRIVDPAISILDRLDALEKRSA